MNLNQYGWNNFFEKAFKSNYNENFLPGRVVVEYGKTYKVITEFGEVQAEVSGKFKKQITLSGLLPAVGDWVILDGIDGDSKALIETVLPRKTKFSRKAAGKETIEQVVAANFDTIFIFNSLNNNFNLRRIERYLVVAYESGATPVVILSKADLCDDVLDKVNEVKWIAPGVDVHAISSKTGYGLEELGKYFKEGSTVALLGSSGVGKSTLINTLANKEILKVQEVREDDDRGRHTTTHRELVFLPNGSIVVDTPGMRELGLWQSSEGMSEVFSDIEELASKCKFSNCRHLREPGCAVKEAIINGNLDQKRFDNYIKLQKEARFVEAKQNQRLRRELKKSSKNLAKWSRSNKKIEY